ISRQVSTLKENFPSFEFLYSVKANPFLPVVGYIASQGFGADAASAQEVCIGGSAGLTCEKILYSTPGKTRSDIETALDKAVIVADSYNELILINDAARKKGLHVKAGLRINAGFSMDGGDEGLSSKFGVDEHTLSKHRDFLNSFSNITVSGIHVHLKSQVLDHSKLSRYYRRIFELALFCREEIGLDVEFINFGGGLGIAYSSAADAPLDIAALGKECEELALAYNRKLNARLLIETGRFAVCEAGLYVTRIADIKESMGAKYLVVEKGLNGFSRPSIAELIASYAGGSGLKGSEPLFTTKDAFDFMIPGGDESALEKVSIVGSLCTATDIMVKDALLPKAKIGDLVIVSKAGSYSYSLSPVLFASHPLPFQFYLKTDGQVLPADH
ncbi:MAG: lysA3, partial [Firmicutes bacterium]|nr:lysA3 [Bacillota bacterium]